MTNHYELNIDELDGASGGSVSGWAHAIVDSAISQAKSAPYPIGITVGSGSGSGSGDGLGGGMGSGSGAPVCPGCHSPA